MEMTTSSIGQNTQSFQSDALSSKYHKRLSSWRKEQLVSPLSYEYHTYSNNVDVVVFSVFEHGYKQCSDDPMGTYIAPVPVFLNGYLKQYAQEEYDQGFDDYVTPDSAQYLDCVQQEVSGRYLYFQIGWMTAVG